MWKHHLNNYWTGKKPLLLPWICILYSSAVGLLLHLQHYQRCEPMILKMWVKSKFVFCQEGPYNLLPEKKIKAKSRFWINNFFKDLMLLSISENSLQKPSLDDIFLGNFTFSNSVEDLIRWNGGFKIFSLTDILMILEIKTSLVSFEKSL